MRPSLVFNLAVHTAVWSASAVKALDASVTQVIDAFLADHPIVTKSASASQSSDVGVQRNSILQGNWSSSLPNMTASLCPYSCSSTALDSFAWPVYHSLDRLKSCNKTMLMDFTLYNNLSDPDTHTSIAACVADLSNSLSAATNSSSTSTLCLPDTNTNNTKTVTASLELAWSSATGSSDKANEVVTALQELRALSVLRSSGCNETIEFALSRQAAVGLYVGSGLASQGILPGVLEKLADHVQSDGVGESFSVQLCDSDGRSSRYSLGIMAQSNGNLAEVQYAVQTWKNSSCISTSDDQTVSIWQNITFQAPWETAKSANNSTKRNALQARDTCTTVQVVMGDGCPSLATECGITGDEFDEYNPDIDCSDVPVGSYVCCSEGELPDYSPQPDSDDNCYVYLVQTGDTCSSIAAAYDLTIADINNYNNDTWGWMGCDDLLANMNICLSTGWPPMPTTISNAVCGPQMNNTPTAPHGTNLSTLNECPLNACCDIWGQCGTTAEFCTISQSTTGAPGTAAEGQNGCISNCGTDIIISGTPSEIFTIGYFEGFDWSRPCLTMSISEVDTSDYTHIHFAFATINTDYTLNITSIQGQLPFFSALSDVKRILSVGGWDFSTDPSTYMIFRDAVTSANRGTLIQSVLDVLDEYDLDGIDWDWEYPDEPDIAGIPAGTTADSTNYYILLTELRAKLEGTGRTVSLTAPASYWYLKQFPIDAISAVVDYIVFMTYDMHGQWDYGNAYADPGCSDGNCLRSHVNLTETINALSMITKAGVSNAQVVVGVASYGRSFKMTTAGCWTEMCTYTGPDSGALPGECTETAGYIANAEIDTIISENPSAEVYWDQESFSNIMVYNDTEWVSYMNSSNKAIRTILYEIYGFLGVADWAIDLQSEGDGSSSSSSSTTTSIGYIGPTIWSESTPVVTGLPGQTLVWPPLQLGSTTTISFDLWTTVISFSSFITYTVTDTDSSMTSTKHAYEILTIPTVISIPPVTTTEIPVWNVLLPTETSDSIIALTSSIQPPLITITVTPVWNGTTSIDDPTTTTQNATVVFWGSDTYTLSATTETVGLSTTITGGTTGTPVPITITPNPHPTTVDTTTDPVLNSKTTHWSSGSPVSPPCATGCGIPCFLWCYSGCPFCPPGLFENIDGGGSGSDGGDGDNDSSSTSTSTTSTTTTTETPTQTAAGFHIDNDETFPDFDDSEYTSLSSSSSAFQSMYDSIFSTSTTTTTTTTTTKGQTTTTTTSSSGTPTPTDGAKYATFFLMELYTGASWIFEWQIIDNIGGETYYPCDISPDIEVTADTVAPDPDYPDTDIGPFESHGISGCQYTAGKDNTIGTMTCPGVDTITCGTDSYANDDFECDGGALMILVFTCWW
ncbi:hypothetical protein BDV11DRAFT_175333 [Aspergillus similis]